MAIRGNLTFQIAIGMILGLLLGVVLNMSFAGNADLAKQVGGYLHLLADSSCISSR